MSADEHGREGERPREDGSAACGTARFAMQLVSAALWVLPWRVRVAHACMVRSCRAEAAVRGPQRRAAHVSRRGCRPRDVDAVSAAGRGRDRSSPLTCEQRVTWGGERVKRGGAVALGGLQCHRAADLWVPLPLPTASASAQWFARASLAPCRRKKSEIAEQLQSQQAGAHKLAGLRELEAHCARQATMAGSKCAANFPASTRSRPAVRYVGGKVARVRCHRVAAHIA